MLTCCAVYHDCTFLVQLQYVTTGQLWLPCPTSWPGCLDSYPGAVPANSFHQAFDNASIDLQRHAHNTGSSSKLQGCYSCNKSYQNKRLPQWWQVQSRKYTATPSPYLEQIITGHARLARHTSRNDDKIASLQGSIQLCIALIALQYRPIQS